MTSESSQPKTEGEAWQKTDRKSSHEFYDPCQDFADRSLKCLKRNGFDREMCGDYFQAYRDCKKNWLNHKKAVAESK
ncbi:Cytochrome c oxidase-assembly factor cox23 [Penicillium angulare]|uniref:Cytochrome c oxidase-assembly factor cox23 n=1 Tax=Penicillium angulare TaxID=116970 RepID=UPI002541E223|nr:Cytochrome c oxidase-assembly factor cox23 [Penicillium angulare]KAJ5281591.1 Cytochrome c oxidase-assembly factor cox23 [Penicillium angulare]